MGDKYLQIFLSAENSSIKTFRISPFLSIYMVVKYDYIYVSFSVLENQGFFGGAVFTTFLNKSDLIPCFDIGIRMNRFFYEYGLEKSNDVYEWLKTIPYTKLIIGGFGICSGLAYSLYLHMLRLSHCSKVEIVTFGAPRIGNAKLWKLLSKRISEGKLSVRNYICTNCVYMDPVCLLPKKDDVNEYISNRFSIFVYEGRIMRSVITQDEQELSFGDVVSELGSRIDKNFIQLWDELHTIRLYRKIKSS